MKILLNLFKKTKPLFRKRPFTALKPVHEALENFFFGPSETTLYAPFSRDALDLKRYMSMVIIGLLPCVLAAYYFFGLRIIAMIIVSYLAGGAVEVAFAAIRKEPIAEGFLVTGLIFPLVLPPALPLWMVAVGCMFGVFIGKELFGGTGRNLFNPAIVGRCFLMLAHPAAMTRDCWTKAGTDFPGRMLQFITDKNFDVISWQQVDALTQATPLKLAKDGIDTSMLDLVWGNIAGCIGETSALLIIIGGVVLMLTRVSNWRTVIATIASAFVLEFLLHHSNPELYKPALWHIMAGGLLFGAFFMATDPVSSPVTNGGKWAYGILIGAVTILIRNLTGYVEGVTFAILLGNIAAPVLDEIVISIRIRRLANEG